MQKTWTSDFLSILQARPQGHVLAVCLHPALDVTVYTSGEKELSRRLFVKRYFFEEKIESIAKEHGLTSASVKVTLHRMRKRLSEFLKKEGFFL